MLESVANIKTLLMKGGCSSINCCHHVIAERSLCEQLKSSVGDILVDPNSMAFKYGIFNYNDIFHGYIDVVGVL